MSGIDVDTSAVGKPLPGAVITVERGPVAAFATALLDRNPVYQSPEAARDAGLPGIPIPPTFPFAMANWGRFREQQPAGWDAAPPTAEVFGKLFEKGGLILHGEQEFLYHAPIVVGDVLTSSGRIKDIYAKSSGERTMTFVVTEEEFRNQRGELVLTQISTILHRV